MMFFSHLFGRAVLERLIPLVVVQCFDEFIIIFYCQTKQHVRSKARDKMPSEEIQNMFHCSVRSLFDAAEQQGKGMVVEEATGKKESQRSEWRNQKDNLKHVQ